MDTANNIRSPRTKLRFALLVTVVVGITAFGGVGTAQAAGCPNANLEPTSVADVPVVQTATRCLVNRERRKRGLRTLRFNQDLQTSADWQSNDMVTNQYFAHERDGGPTFVSRITRFGYAKDSGGYALGENIAWSTSDAASPAEIVSMWMHSPGHRANILRRQFHEQAISAVYVAGTLGGDYDGAGPVVVYVNQFGTRY
jgi:uncharacterized protein YkwD